MVYLKIFILNIKLFEKNYFPKTLKWAYPSAMGDTQRSNYKFVWDDLKTVNPLNIDKYGLDVKQPKTGDIGMSDSASFRTEESTKTIQEIEIQNVSTVISVPEEELGNYPNDVFISDFSDGKIPFILPYGSQRRPNGLENRAAIEQAARATVESARALNWFYVFDSLRYDIYGATANNSTASDYIDIAPSLPASLTTGSNTIQGSSLVRAVRSLNGFLPAGAGPLHLPQTLESFVVAHPRALVTSRQGQGSLFTRKLGHQSNRMWWLSGSCCG